MVEANEGKASFLSGVCTPYVQLAAYTPERFELYVHLRCVVLSSSVCFDQTAFAPSKGFLSRSLSAEKGRASFLPFISPFPWTFCFRSSLLRSILLNCLTLLSLHFTQSVDHRDNKGFSCRSNA